MAVVDKAQLLYNIRNEIPDNVVGEISPRDVRHNLIDIVESVQIILAGENIQSKNFATPETRNTLAGIGALDSFSSSSDSTAVGHSALTQSYTANQNTAIGSQSMYCHMTGNANSALGYKSLYSNTTGSGNVAVGAHSLRYNINGDRNVAIGHGAGLTAKGNGELYIDSLALDPDCTCDGDLSPEVSGRHPLIYGDFGAKRVGIATKTLSGQGVLEVAGNITPSGNNVFTLGSNDLRWATLYMGSKVDYQTDLHFINESDTKVIFKTDGQIGLGTAYPSGTSGLNFNNPHSLVTSKGAIVPFADDSYSVGASGLSWGKIFARSINYNSGLNIANRDGNDVFTRFDDNGMHLQTSGVNRWYVSRGTEREKGQNTGSNFHLSRYADNGSFLGTPLCVTRPSGLVGINTCTPASRLHVVGDVRIDGALNVHGSAIFIQRDDCIFSCVTLYLASSGLCEGGFAPCSLYTEDFIASGGIILQSSGTIGIDAPTGVRNKEWIWLPDSLDHQRAGCGHPSQYWTSNIPIQTLKGAHIRTDRVQAFDGDGLELFTSGCYGLVVNEGSNQRVALGKKEVLDAWNWSVSDGNTNQGTHLNILSSGSETSDEDVSAIRHSCISSGVTVSLQLLADSNELHEGFDLKYIDTFNDTDRFAIGAYHRSSTPVNAFTIMRDALADGLVGITDIGSYPLPDTIFNIQATGDAVARVFASGVENVSSLQLLSSGNTPRDGFEIEYSEQNKRTDFNIYNSNVQKSHALTISKRTQHVGVGENAPNERLSINGVMSLKEQADAYTGTVTTDYGKIFHRGGKAFLLNDAGTEYDLTLGNIDEMQTLFIASGVGSDQYGNTWAGRKAFESRTSTAQYNTSYGNSALLFSSSAKYNTAFGYSAGSGITSGRNNVAIGPFALKDSNGFDNIAIGHSTLSSAVSNYSVAIGSQAGQSNTGDLGVFIGYQAGQFNPTNSAFFLANGAVEEKVLASGDFSTGEFCVPNGHLRTKADIIAESGINVPYYGTGTSKATIMYGKTNRAATPDSDGFRIKSDAGFFGTNEDALVFEKTGSDSNPDGGIGFINTGNDGVEEIALAIRGDGKIGVGTKSPTETLQVDGGSIKVATTGKGIYFPDGSFQDSAATSTVGGGDADITAVRITAGDGLDGTKITETGQHVQTLDVKVSDLIGGGITYDSSNNFRLKDAFAGEGLKWLVNDSDDQQLGIDLGDIAGRGLIKSPTAQTIHFDISSLYDYTSTTLNDNDLFAFEQHSTGYNYKVKFITIQEQIMDGYARKIDELEDCSKGVKDNMYIGGLIPEQYPSTNTSYEKMYNNVVLAGVSVNYAQTYGGGEDEFGDDDWISNQGFSSFARTGANSFTSESLRYPPARDHKSGGVRLPNFVNCNANVALGLGTIRGRGYDNRTYSMGGQENWPVSKNFAAVVTHNVAVGFQAGYRGLGSHTVAMGAKSFYWFNPMQSENNQDYASDPFKDEEVYWQTGGGHSNVGVGYKSGYFLIQGHNNTYVGAEAGSSGPAASWNSSDGAAVALHTAYAGEAEDLCPGGTNQGSIASQNVAIGDGAGRWLGWKQTEATKNVLVGSQSACHAGTNNNRGCGTMNIAIGYKAGLAWGSSSSAAVLQEAVCIGANSSYVGSYSITLGAHAGISLYSYSNLQVISDARTKRDVSDNLVGLDFINKLRTVSYKKINPADYPEEILHPKFAGSSDRPKDDDRGNIGLLAQEVKSVVEDSGIECDVVNESEANGSMFISYANLVPMLIKAVQELSDRVKELEKE